ASLFVNHRHIPITGRQLDFTIDIYDTSAIGRQLYEMDALIRIFAKAVPYQVFFASLLKKGGVNGVCYAGVFGVKQHALILKRPFRSTCDSESYTGITVTPLGVCVV